MQPLSSSEAETIETVILDMDGTIYQNQYESGRKACMLHHQLVELHHAFVESLCGDGNARQILEEALRHPVGASAYLSEKYGVTRDDVFSNTWNKLDVAAIVIPREEERETVRSLRASVREMILCTAAPALWMRKVTDALTIDRGIFDAIITAGDMGSKPDMFKKLSESRVSRSMYSIGDTHESDIEPAHRLGMHAYHVTPATPFPGSLHLFPAQS